MPYCPSGPDSSANVLVVALLIWYTQSWLCRVWKSVYLTKGSSHTGTISRGVASTVNMQYMTAGSPSEQWYNHRVSALLNACSPFR